MRGVCNYEYKILKNEKVTTTTGAELTNGNK